MELWKEIAISLKQEEVELVASIIRRLWLRRNDSIFEGKFLEPKGVMRFAVEGYREYVAVQVQRKGL